MSENNPVGHALPFTGSMEKIVHDVQVVAGAVLSRDVKEITGKDVVGHGAELLGELNALRPDKEEPVIMESAAFDTKEKCAEAMLQEVAPKGDEAELDIDPALLYLLLTKLLKFLF